MADHLDELAAALTGIDDRFDMPDFSELRQAALIALVVTHPARAAPWCAKQYFAGDYSLAQRAMLLVALGLGARELAGLAPPPAHELAAVSALAEQLQRTLLTPIASRTFSSRMAVAARTAAPAASPLAALAAKAFVRPMAGYLAIAARDAPGAPQCTSPVLLALFVDTLAIVFSAAGGGVRELREVAEEVLGVAMGARAMAERDARVRQSVLVACLAVLEVLVEAWGPRRVVDEMGEMVGEIGEWVAGVWESDVEGESRVAAAAVLRYIGECGDGWKRGVFGGLGVMD